MRAVRPAWLAAVLLLLLAGCAREEAATLPLAPCTLRGGLEARCGRLAVPENRDDPEGRTISLNVAVVPARDRLPEPSPLFYLAGGPGQAAVATFPLAAEAFTRINREHAIVLVDQRGTGESNPLNCPELDDELDLTEPAPAEVRKEAEACVAALNADLAAYTTADTVADLEAVREALGYETINLYGGSYGTRLALAYMRTYPIKVRAAILDAVVPPEYTLFLDTPADAQRALALLFARCAADAGCAEHFPALAETFRSLLAQFEEAPLAVTLDDPVTGERLTVELDRATFAQLVFSLMYSPELVSLLPLMLTEAAESGEFAPLVAQGLVRTRGQGISEGLFYSVACAEDAPRMTAAEAEARTEGTDFPVFARSLLTVCEVWPAEPDLSFSEPLPPLAIPVLLLSGEADPVTPPAYAAALAAQLPQSAHLVAPGVGHTVIDRGCLPRVAATFLEAASVTDLDAGCVDEIAPPPFFVDYLGPA